MENALNECSFINLDHSTDGSQWNPLATAENWKKFTKLKWSTYIKYIPAGLPWYDISVATPIKTKPKRRNKNKIDILKLNPFINWMKSNSKNTQLSNVLNFKNVSCCCWFHFSVNSCFRPKLTIFRNVFSYIRRTATTTTKM